MLSTTAAHEPVTLDNCENEPIHIPGGHHNSVTRVVLKPTHMIGGYAQQAWGFNYYGTVGCNRDEFVVVRKMSKIDWLDGTEHGGLGGDALPQPLPQDIE